jgi:ribosomal protein L27
VQGKDHTIFATIVGNVRFTRDSHRSRTFISVQELEELPKQTTVVASTA